jgi:hypothetical protein
MMYGHEKSRPYCNSTDQDVVLEHWDGNGRPRAAELGPWTGGISCSTSGLIRGLPGVRRAFEPSNLRATNLRYQARMVSGRATLATSPRTLRPNRLTVFSTVSIF